MRYKMSR
jgi:hypothetical protein